MKRNLIFAATVILTVFLFSNITVSNTLTSENTSGPTALEIPEDVQKTINNNCFGCHNLESKNEKGKKALLFDTLDSLSVSKLVGTLAEIAEEGDEGNMPPAKFLEHYPEKALTKAQSKALVKWANSKAESLLEE